MRHEDLFPVPSDWIQEVDGSMSETVAQWAEQEVISRRLEHREDYDSLILPATRKLFLDIGLQAMLWPEELGGGGVSSPEAAATMTVVLEQVGAADTGIGILLANTFALQSAFGIEPNRDESVLQELAPIFAGGEVGTGSLVLPGFGNAGGDGAARFNGLEYQVTVERSDKGWELSGRDVRPQCSGATASLFGVVFPHEDGSPAVGLIRSDSKGLSAGEVFKKTGLSASVNADLTLESVEVPEAHVVAKGAEGVRGVLSFYQLSCAAVCAGALLAASEILKEWGETRVIKGKGHIFKDNPLVASLMGEVGIRVGTSRMLTYSLARMLSKPDFYGPPGGDAMHATATAVFKYVARSAMQALDNSMELMASAGYATEWNLERYWRDVKTVETYVVAETVAETELARHYFGSFANEAGG